MAQAVQYIKGTIKDFTLANLIRRLSFICVQKITMQKIHYYVNSNRFVLHLKYDGQVSM